MYKHTVSKKAPDEITKEEYVSGEGKWLLILSGNREQEEG
jgi:hypothetical protein